MPQANERHYLKSYRRNICIRGNKLFDNEKEVLLEKPEQVSSNDDSEAENQRHALLSMQANALVRDHQTKLISRPFEHIVFLAGAGTSHSSGGCLMSDMWAKAFPSNRSKEDGRLFEMINFPPPENESERNIEDLLSHAQRAAEVYADPQRTEIRDWIRRIEQTIVECCTLTLSDTAPHVSFLKKITTRKPKYARAKVFTLNYDTLFEQAAAKGNLLTISGFTFSMPSTFDGSFFDYDIVNRRDARVSPEDSFVARVFHLYKPHGSVNWQRIGDGRIMAGDIFQSCENPLIIYPNSGKYESAYDQPFFEMVSRFQQSVRLPNTLLQCIGFSFRDKHFSNVIVEAIKSNPGLVVLIVLPDFGAQVQLSQLCDLASTHNNILLIDEDFEQFAKDYPFPPEYQNAE